MPAKVLIVDDHPVMLEGLRRLLSGEPDFELCGEADSASAAMIAIERTKPQIVILDLFLGADDDLEVVSRIHRRWPDLRILVVSMQEETLFAERMLAMGARGFLMKREVTNAIHAAIRKVISGEYYVSAALGNRLFSRKARTRHNSLAFDVLTTREREVLADMASGRSSQDIAKHLGVNVKTVASHKRAMREKLGLSSRADLVRYATHWMKPSSVSQSEDTDDPT
jgi:DNA-binding NarL/FixJ family response regulator